jgi:hypothetical protein
MMGKGILLGEGQACCQRKGWPVELGIGCVLSSGGADVQWFHRTFTNLAYHLVHLWKNTITSGDEPNDFLLQLRPWS